MADQIIDEHHWDYSITPKRSLFSFNVKELWHYRDLLSMFVKKDIVTVYKQTILGPLWFIIQPVMTTMMFVVVFGRIAKIPTGGVPNILFYLSSLTLWNYFSETLNITSKTFVDNASVFGKVYFPRLILPLSRVVSGLIKFFIQFAIFIVVWLYYITTTDLIHPNAMIVLVPFLIAIVALMSLGFGIIITSMTTKYRDLAFLVTFGVQLVMYATPVIFPIANISEGKRFYLWLNPLSAIFEAFKYGFLGSGTLDFFWLGYSAAFTVVLLLFGIVIFNRVEKKFIDSV